MYSIADIYANAKSKCFHITVDVSRASSRCSAKPLWHKCVQAGAFWVATADLQAGFWPSPGRRRAALTTARLRLDPSPLGCWSEPGNGQTTRPQFGSRVLRGEPSAGTSVPRPSSLPWRTVTATPAAGEASQSPRPPAGTTEEDGGRDDNISIGRRLKDTKCERDLMLMVLYSIDTDLNSATPTPTPTQSLDQTTALPRQPSAPSPAPPSRSSGWKTSHSKRIKLLRTLVGKHVDVPQLVQVKCDAPKIPCVTTKPHLPS